MSVVTDRHGVRSRNDNEKIDFEAAVEELEKSSLIDIADRDDDMFISVPLAASIYGAKELEVSPLKIQILSDKKLLMEFGAGSAKSMATLESHIAKKMKALRDRISTEQMFMKELPSMECLSSKYPQIWKDIANFYRRFGKIEKEKECYRELLKVTKDQESKMDCWKTLSRICKDSNDWIGESSALLEVISMPNVPYEEISYAAYRINKYYFENSDDDDASKNYLIKEVIRKMESRIKEANAADCSRLAWLCLNTQDEVKSLKYARMGLGLDKDNRHCQNLVKKLSM